MRDRSPGARVGRAVLILVLVLIALVLAAFLLLFATAPGPLPAQDWVLEPDLPAARGELATAVTHVSPCPEPPCPEAERLFVLGGMSGLGRATDAVTSFDPVTRSWTEMPALPEPRHHPAAAGFEEAVYLSGGTTDVMQPWTPLDNLWRLAAGAGSWQALEPMPEGRFGHRMVEHGGRLYMVGGVGPTSRVLIYTPGQGWRAGAEMPHQRDHVSAVVVDDRIWVIGGRSPRSVARVDIYDPAADAWSPGPDLPEPTSGAAEGVIDGVILVFGGEEPAFIDGTVFDRHWMLDTRSEMPAWEAAPRPPLVVHGADGAVFQGDLVIAGGASRHGYLSVTAWTGVVQRLDGTAIRTADVPDPAETD